MRHFQKIIDGEWNPVRHRSSWPSTNRRKNSQRFYTSCRQRLTLWAVEWGGAKGFSLSRLHILPVISFSVPGLPKPNSASSSRGALCWIPEFPIPRRSRFPNGRHWPNYVSLRRTSDNQYNLRFKLSARSNIRSLDLSLPCNTYRLLWTPGIGFLWTLVGCMGSRVDMFLVAGLLLFSFCAIVVLLSGKPSNSI